MAAKMENTKEEELYENDLTNLKDTELTLGLPGTHQKSVRNNNNKRLFTESSQDHSATSTQSSNAPKLNSDSASPPKAKIVGWPPIRSYRKNSLKEKEEECGGIYVKVSMDGAPYLRKIDLRVYTAYSQLLKALENMFNLTIGRYSERDGYEGSEFAPTYQDKDGDWMLVGDVPWDMFISSCKRLRIMKASEAKGLGCGKLHKSSMGGIMESIIIREIDAIHRCDEFSGNKHPNGSE
ncbi:auxin-induced protein 22B-like [Senna tora]|uniref:Auxin-induced protein n=1 Tax=Senna tora TaxID=362788 RepID=A0A835CCH5_9FABA|nr:auxin-induced protein 22B-like [Senna tora]